VGVSASPSSPFAITVGPTQQPSTSGLCTALVGDVAIYTKGLFQTSYTRSKFARLKGSWYGGDQLTSPYCELVVTSGDQVFTGSYAETKVSTSMSVPWGTSVKVVAGFKLNDWQSVRVQVAPDPPIDPPK
jgi:hypothetical protein